MIRRAGPWTRASSNLPRLDEAVPTGNFADSEVSYPTTERSGERYDQPGASGSEGVRPSIPPRVKRPTSRTRRWCSFRREGRGQERGLECGH